MQTKEPLSEIFQMRVRDLGIEDEMNARPVLLLTEAKGFRICLPGQIVGPLFPLPNCSP